MEKIKSTLAEWRALPVTMVPLERIETDVALQPRARDVVAARDRYRQDEDSERHIAGMRADLAAFPDKEMEPLLVAEAGGRWLLVDGHHRLQAYRLACRGVVPVRLRSLSFGEAVMVSKLVNCDGVKLQLHKNQAAEAAWQYLAHITERGRKPLPPGLSFRAIAGTFRGTSKSTIERMVKTLPLVKLEDFAEEARDPGTDWPRWHHCKGNAWRDAFGDVPLDDRLANQARRFGERFSAMVAKAPHPKVPRMAVSYLREVGKEEAADLLEHCLDAEYVDDPHGDY